MSRPPSLRLARSHGICFRLIDGEQRQDADHFEYLQNEGRRIHQLGVASQLRRHSERVDYGADAR